MWYPARVVAAHEDGRFSVDFDEIGFWGTGGCVGQDLLEALETDYDVETSLGAAATSQPSSGNSQDAARHS